MVVLKKENYWNKPPSSRAFKDREVKQEQNRKKYLKPIPFSEAELFLVVI